MPNLFRPKQKKRGRSDRTYSPEEAENRAETRRVAWAEGEVQRLVDGPHFEMPGAQYQHLPNDLKEDTLRQKV